MLITVCNCPVKIYSQTMLCIFIQFSQYHKRVLAVLSHTGLHQTRQSWDAVLNSCHRRVLAVLYTHRPTPDQTQLRCCTELMSQTSVSSSVHTQAYTRPDSWDAVLNSCHRRVLAVLYTHRPTPDQTELRCCTELMSQTSVSSSVHTQAYTRPDRVEMLYWTHVTDEC